MGDHPFHDLDRPPLSGPALRRALTGPDGAWRAVEVLASTGSTNADLVARAAAGEQAGLVLVADHQEGGRGRLARTWIAPPRSSIAVSVLLRPTGVPPSRFGWLPLLAALAVVEALTRRCGLPARVKWPNDVLVDVGGEPRKVCGILAEAVPAAPGGPGEERGTAVVLGAGINVTQTPAELAEVAQLGEMGELGKLAPAPTSLRLAGSATTDRDTLLRAYLRALADRYQAFIGAAGDPRAGGIGPAYREACSTLGQRVAVHLPGGRTEQGLAQEVDDDGRLIVLVNGEPRPFAAGDVVHLRPAARQA